MNTKLLIQAIIKYAAGVILMGMMIFWPAGTLNYKSGWILMAILFIPMFIAGLVLLKKNPELLKKRLNNKEKLGEQKMVILLSGLMFTAGFVLAGFDYRYKWLQLPGLVSKIGVIVFLISYAMYAEVLRENTYLSRTIEVQENQKVIDTGLYGIIRHPMYSATVLLFCSMPVVLGSGVSFIIFLTYLLIIAKRIRSEEEFLEKELNGYAEYKKKVRYRLIPYIW